MRRAKVYMREHLAGVLIETDAKKFVFRYDDAYFNDDDMPTISLTMSKKNQEYYSDTLFPFFYNMLTEGENREIQMRLFKLDENDDFGLLLKIAQFDTIGAVTVKPIDDNDLKGIPKLKNL